MAQTHTWWWLERNFQGCGEYMIKDLSNNLALEMSWVEQSLTLLLATQPSIDV